MKKLVVVLLMLVAINTNAQWQPDVRLTNNDSASWTSHNNAWCVASSGSFVHVVWDDGRDGPYREIYYNRSTDAGVSWETDARLTNNTYWSSYPSVAVSGSFVHVVWIDERDGNEEIYYKRSTDAGVSWGADTRLTNNSANSDCASVSVSGSAVHVVWSDNRDGNYEIYYKRSTDAGVSWGTDTRLTNNYAYSSPPSVAVSGSVVHVAWEEFRDLNSEIYYKRSTDGGINWGADIRLTNNTSSSRFPSVAVSGSVVHVFWYDYLDGNEEIYYKRSTTAGVSWGVNVRMTNDTSISAMPSVAVSGSVVHVVWYDNRHDYYGDIYYKQSTNGGINWGADTRLTDNIGFSGNSSVAVSGSVVHVVWMDERDGNLEIYYKRNPTGNVGIQNISTETPSAYSLSQNYPNPFNPVTKIKFDIEKTENRKQKTVTTITVYDLLGKEVAVLVNEELQAGSYEVTFDASGLPSGVYYYRLSGSNFTESKKMMLVK